MVYSHWIHEIIDKGKANDFVLLNYPDIVQLRNIDPTGHWTNIKIIERRTAQQEIDKYPQAYDFVEIDIKKQIISDINKSNKIANKQKKQNQLSKLKRPFKNKIFYYLSFLLIFPFFSKRVRNKTINFIDENINTIQTISTIIMILLTIYIIVLMIEK